MSPRRPPDDVRDEPAHGAAPNPSGSSDRVADEPHLAHGDAGPRPDPGQRIGDEPALATAPSAPSWRDHVADQARVTTRWQQWRAVLVAALIGGPFAVVGALTAGINGQSAAVAIIAVVVVAPAAEEVLKASGALWLTERRPWLVPAAWTLPAITVTAGLVFAAVENALYLWVYVPDPSPELVAFRWLWGPLVHTSGALLSGIGVARAHRATLADERLRGLAVPTAHADAVRPWLYAAWAVHASYNATVTVLSYLEVGVPTG